jgi:antimicrobial peptide system SdpB family protein
LFDVHIAKWICITLLLFAISGLLPQLSILLQTWAHTSICNSFFELDGGDQIAANMCLLLIPICLLDKRINAWKNTDLGLRLNINIFCNVFFFLLMLQVAVIYFHAGAGKLNVEEWLDGTCIYYWTTNNVFGAPEFIQPFLNLFTLSGAAPILSWGVIFLELSLFGCLFATNVKIKRLFLLLGILFHFSIFVVHGLASFFLSTSGALILFLDSENYIFNKLSGLKYYLYNKSNLLKEDGK